MVRQSLALWIVLGGLAVSVAQIFFVHPFLDGFAGLAVFTLFLALGSLDYLVDQKNKGVDQTSHDHYTIL